MKSVCVGLLVIFFCDAGPQPTVQSDFCAIAGPQIERLKSLTTAELQAMSRQRKEAIRNLRQDYKRLCS